jgi:uncharacterized phage protein (TIGR02218 family)
MRSASVQLAAAIALDATTLCRLWRVTRKDGVVLRFTDAVRPISIALAPDVTPQTYRSDLSFTASAILTTTTAANMQSVTLTTFLSDNDAAAFVEKDLRLRLFDGAVAEIFVCDYAHPSYGAVSMFDGVFGVIKLSNEKIATIEVQPGQTVSGGAAIGIEKYSRTCRANLGDAQCKVNMTPLKVAFTVTAANGGIITATAFSQPAGHWTLGFIKWLTGNNAGNQQAIVGSDPISHSVFLTSPPQLAVQVGDTGEVYPGCDKTRTTCKNVFNNLINMRAEPDVPTGAGTPGTNYNSALPPAL